MSRGDGVHVAVDALGAKHSGGAVVLLDFLRALLESRDVREVTLYSAPREDRAFELPASPKLRDRPQPRFERSLPLRVLWNARSLGDTALADRADVVVSMAATMLPHPQMPHVGFVQQSLPFCAEALATLPARQRGRMRFIREMTRRSCRGARRIYVQSPTMRAWVGQAFSIEPSRFEVVLPEPRLLEVPDATPAALAPLEACPRGARILYVGSAEPYKNLRVVLRALPLLRAIVPGATIFATWPPDHPACRRGDVVGLGYLRDASLGKAYALADVLVQPSLVESGPLTMTEAMGVKTPVVVADRPYARDICEDAALFFDPRDPTHLVEQLTRVLREPSLRSTLVQRGARLAARRIDSAPYAQMVDSIVRLL